MTGRDERHDRTFRALLKVFPAEFRGDFGAQMADDFRDQRTDARAHGGRARVLRLWCRTALDLLRSAPRHHFDILKRDAGHAVRLLRKRPASTATVVLSLALGIGLNTALFTVVNGVLWNSLPFPDSQLLVRIDAADARTPERRSALTRGEVAALRESRREFSAVGGAGYLSDTWVSPGEPEQLPGMVVTDGFFEALRARAILGRTFSPGEYAATNARPEGEGPAPAGVMVISSGLWQRRFGGSPDVIGTPVRLANRSVAVIIGVMGPEMAVLTPTLGESPEWWRPQPLRPGGPRDRAAAFLDVIARMTPPGSLQRAQTELDALARDIPAATPPTAAVLTFRATPLLETVVARVRPQLTFLLAAVLCALGVTCVNVVHLSLAIAAGRRVELATRTALGATRAALIRQTLTESAVLALLGCIGGVLVAAWSLPLLLSIAPSGVPRLDEIALNRTALGFAVGVSATVALVCGLTASVPVVGVRPWTAFSSVRGTPALRGRRLRGGLAVGEIAAAMVLVVAAMLMVRTMRAFSTLDLGFDPSGVVTANLPRPVALDPDDPQRLARIRDIEVRVVEAVKALPGVVTAGVGGSPLGMRLGISGVKIPGSDRELPALGLMPVGVGYFEALGARLQAGRFFTVDDRAGAPSVAILTESAARTIWPSGSAVGQMLMLREDNAVRVVGVIADLSEFGLESKGGGIFLPHVQSPFLVRGTMLIRTDRDPETLVPAIKSIVRQANPEEPFPGVTSMQSEIDKSTAPRRFISRLIGLFSLLALTLAVIGVYGVLAESAAERVPEIGVRLALGARRSDIVRLMMRRGLALVVTGVVLGLLLAVALRQEMRTLVFGVDTLDALSYLGAAATLLSAGAAASLIPAVRAARLQAAVALRAD